METSLGYAFDYTSTKEIKIEDLGNACLDCVNTKKNYHYYLIAHTSYGKTSIFTCGPIVPDESKLLSGYNASYTRMDYEEYEIEKYIDKFINNKYFKIDEVNSVDVSDAISGFRNISSYILCDVAIGDIE